LARQQRQHGAQGLDGRWDDLIHLPFAKRQLKKQEEEAKS
jgi:hypothetical protein